MTEIERALERKGLSASAASLLAVGNASFIKNLRNRRTERERAHPLENLAALCEVLDLEFHVGPPRQGMGEAVATVGEDGEFALIPSFDVRASAGNGATGVDAAPDRMMAFRTDWLTQIGVSASNAVLLRASGDSMEPLIWHGDVLLVDRSRTAQKVRAPGTVSLRKGYQDDIYVIERDGDLRVKAVRRPAEDRLILISENAARYDPDILQGAEIDRLRVIGKVVWWGHASG